MFGRLVYCTFHPWNTWCLPFQTVVIMPVFWRSPHNVIHATVDLGQMVEWVSQQLELEAGENGCLAVLWE